MRNLAINSTTSTMGYMQNACMDVYMKPWGSPTRIILRLALSFALFLALASPSLAQAETPTHMTQQLIESMTACKDEANEANEAGEPNARDRALAASCDVEKIEGHLALAQLARWLMGPYWEGLGEEKQQDFAALLVRLLREVAYPRAADFLSSTQIVYGKNHIEGKEALVETALVDPEEGQVAINYRLHHIDGVWKVWDVQLDGVSMAGNLRKQVQSLMSRKSYEELVERMQKKLNWEGPQ